VSDHPKRKRDIEWERKPYKRATKQNYVRKYTKTRSSRGAEKEAIYMSSKPGHHQHQQFIQIEPIACSSRTHVACILEDTCSMPPRGHMLHASQKTHVEPYRLFCQYVWVREGTTPGSSRPGS